MNKENTRGPDNRKHIVLASAVWGSVLALGALVIAFAPGAGVPSASAASTTSSSASGSVMKSSSASASASSASASASSASASASATAADNGTCVICHTDADALEAAGLPDDKDATAYLVSQAFLDDPIHGQITCVTCHSGDATADTKDAAHDGMVTDPSDTTMSGSCGVSGCHDDKASTFEGSLHKTDEGVHTKLCTRLSGQKDGKDLADQIWSKDCYSCHATCGQCHISNPTANGGGLLQGHVFTRADTQSVDDKTCAFCHDNIGPDFINKDVHYKVGMSCAQCHKSIEFHGSDLTNSATDYHEATTANCLECHQDIVGTGAHTEEHLDNATCQTCHAQPYDTCFNCHDNEVVDQVKLGYGTDGKIHTLVHVPVDHEMYLEDYGVTLDPDTLGTKATWVEVAVHTMQEAIPNQELCDRCHGAGTALLTEDDLQYPDQEEQMVVTPLEEESPSAGD